MRQLFFFLPLFVFGIAFLPHFAFAANAHFFGPIIDETCSCRGRGSAADWGCVLQTFQNVINLFVSLSTLFFTGVLAYGGVMFMGSSVNPGMREQAKKVLFSSVVGFGIMLSGWLIVDFVMKAVYNEQASGQGVGAFGPWNTILSGGTDNQCLIEHDLQPTTSNNGNPNNGNANNGGLTTEPNQHTGGTPPSGFVAGVSTKDGSVQTSGLKGNTVTQINNLATACKTDDPNCQIVITSGTEGDHACTSSTSLSHCNGYKVDIRSTSNGSAFTSWVTGNLTQGNPVHYNGCDSALPQYHDSCGNSYVHEQGSGSSCNDHWDVTITSVCSPTGG